MLACFAQQRLGISLLGDCCAAAAARFSSHAFPSFLAADLEVQSRATPNPKLPEELPFGKVFTDHMLLVQHSTASGWERPRIVPFGPLKLHPAAQVLHYGMTCFEGMKAFQGQDAKGRLFRPQMNMARLARSAQRLCLADFDPQELQECIAALLRLDRAWMPDRPGHSMYIRPFMFGSDGALGVHRSNATTLAVILSPVGPYFKSGPSAVRLFLDTSNVRAWPGGAGAFKVGGNYAPTVSPQLEALRQRNCSQVMYALPQGPDPNDAVISECGAMNMFFVLGSSGGIDVVTPPLDGTILPGVTRDSIIQLLKGRGPGVTVSERPLTVGELLAAHQQRRLLEAFGCGTACVVQPVGCIITSTGQELPLAAGGESPIAPGSPVAAGEAAEAGGSVADWLRQQLMDIQYGRVRHPWSVPYE